MYSTFDYAIIGAGAAGLQLALAMSADSFFSQKKIILIDKKQDFTINDKRWCFWEKGEGKWDRLITASWKKGHFYSTKGHKILTLEPYTYKMLRADDFYAYSTNVIRHNIQFLHSEVLDVVTLQDQLIIKTTSGEIACSHIFDSRIENAPGILPEEYTHLLQHFAGWSIKTKQAVFNPNEFVMMDFRYGVEDTCSFTYLLPFSETEALIECTLFSATLIPPHIYEQKIKHYIQQELNIEEYNVTETEKGIIPMSSYPFHKASSPRITKIGTAGGWVKPSSGYSFKNCEKNVAKIIRNIKQNKHPDEDIYDMRHRYYDSLFLDVLHRNNASGSELFHTMYTKNSVQQIFRFLDEETSLMEDFAIMASYNALPFMQSIWKQVMKMTTW